MLKPHATASEAFIVEAKRPLLGGTPQEYRYICNVVNGHKVYLADAVEESNVTELAGVMLNRLKRDCLHVRMFFVSGPGFVDLHPLVKLSTVDCLYNICVPQLDSDKVTDEAQRNAQRLLNAAIDHQDTRSIISPEVVPVLNYDDMYPDLALHICRGCDFFGLPTMVFFGMCQENDVSEAALYNVGAVAAIQIIGVLQHMEMLEARVLMV